MHAMPASTAPRIPMSWQDYERLSPDDVRGEYIDGALLVSPHPSRVHQRIARRLANALERAAGDAAEVDESWGWMPAKDEFGPDVLVYAPTEEVKRLTSIPHLAVEVLSSDRGRDTVLKFGKYQAAGLPRYWIVDPDGPTLTAYELEDGEYRLVGDFGPDDEADLDVGPARLRLRPGDLVR